MSLCRLLRSRSRRVSHFLPSFLLPLPPGICLSIKEPQAGYRIEHGILGLPYVARARSGVANGQTNGQGLVLHEVTEEKKRM